MNRRPKSSKKRPPGALNGPQERPGRPQERPKRRQDGPKRRQEHPKSSPRAAQEAKKRSKKGHHLRLGSRGGLREASGSHFGSILEAPGSILEPFSKLFEASWAGKPGEKPEANARNASSSERPAQAAQRSSKGIKRSTPLAILMLALLSPRLLCCSSWSFSLFILAVFAALLAFSVAGNACGSRFERASRSMIARFRSRGHARKQEKCSQL